MLIVFWIINIIAWFVSFFLIEEENKYFSGLLVTIISNALSIWLIDKTGQFASTLCSSVITISLFILSIAFCESWHTFSEELSAILLFFGIAGTLITIGLFITSIIKPYYDESSQGFETAITKIEVSEPQEAIPIYGMSYGGMINGADAQTDDEHTCYMLLSVLPNGISTYSYQCRNAQGALVTKSVPANEHITMIFDVLGENEQPYMREVLIYQITTDNSTEPASEHQEVIDTIYHFYIPKKK